VGLDHCFDLSLRSGWVVGERQADASVYFDLVCEVCAGDGLAEVAQGRDKLAEFTRAHAAAFGLVLEPCFGCLPLSLGFGYPTGDELGVGSGLEGSAVLAEFGVAVGDVAPCLLLLWVGRGGVVGLLQFAEELRQGASVEPVG
jgi:hypothetical protein